MRMAWFTVCLLAGPAALGQSAADPEGVPVNPPGVFVAPQFSGPQQIAPPVWQKRMQPPQMFAFAKPAPMPPVAKGIPIPTQWPNAKMEQIPTRWPQLKVVPLGAQSQPGPPAIPRQK
jgi:hypothetical protein